MKAHVLRDGGQGELLDITPEKLMQDAVAFPGRVLAGKGIPLSVLILPYENLPFEDIKIKPCVNKGCECLEQLGENHEILRMKQNDLIYALENIEYFPGINEKEVAKRIKLLQKEINEIELTATLFSRNPTECKIPELKNDLLDDILPKRVVPSRLGDIWYIELQGGYLGVYQNTGKKNEKGMPVFEGEFVKRTTVHAGRLEFHELSNEIYFYRKDDMQHNDDHVAYYKGTISEDGNKASGIELSNENINWTATIVHK